QVNDRVNHRALLATDSNLHQLSPSGQSIFQAVDVDANVPDEATSACICSIGFSLRFCNRRGSYLTPQARSLGRTTAGEFKSGAPTKIVDSSARTTRRAGTGAIRRRLQATTGWLSAHSAAKGVRLITHDLTSASPLEAKVSFSRATNALLSAAQQRAGGATGW